MGVKRSLLRARMKANGIKRSTVLKHVTKKYKIEVVETKVKEKKGKSIIIGILCDCNTKPPLSQSRHIRKSVVQGNFVLWGPERSFSLLP